MKGFFNKSGDWWEGFGTGLFCAFVGLLSGKLWRGEAKVLELIGGVSWGLVIAVGFFVGLYLINKPRLDREAEERRKISKKYERWVHRDYTIEELQDIERQR
jgi:hypothetical protein